jgi:mRNA interferase HigB
LALDYHFGNLMDVRIIGKVAITRFAKDHKDALEPLMHWYGIAKRAQWPNITDVREDFGHADAVGLFTVFNIGGNKYRLITVTRYRWQVVYVRHVLTHSEYDKEKWRS